jgi:hypothetical protein
VNLITRIFLTVTAAVSVAFAAPSSTSTYSAAMPAIRQDISVTEEEAIPPKSLESIRRHLDFPANKKLPPKEWLRSVALDKDFALLEEVAHHESGWNSEVCNKKYGCTSGQGLFQIIPSTFDRTCKPNIPVFDVFEPYDNMKCALWLFYFTPGHIDHWRPYSGPYTNDPDNHKRP